VRISKQTALLAGIGTLDLITTLYLVHLHSAAEANPLMRFFLAQGTVVFIAAKLTLLVGPLCLLEWARRRRPTFVQRASSIAVVAYASLYFCGVAFANIAPQFKRAPDNEALRARLWSEIQTAIQARKSMKTVEEEAGMTERAVPAQPQPAPVKTHPHFRMTTV
jgi:hypothetical protein